MRVARGLFSCNAFFSPFDGLVVRFGEAPPHLVAGCVDAGIYKPWGRYYSFTVRRYAWTVGAMLAGMVGHSAALLSGLWWAWFRRPAGCPGRVRARHSLCLGESWRGPSGGKMHLGLPTFPLRAWVARLVHAWHWAFLCLAGVTVPG